MGLTIISMLTEAFMGLTIISTLTEACYGPDEYFHVNRSQP
jgi:hypothetical protein